MFRISWLALIGLIAWSAAVSTQTSTAENVVLITVDGARWQEVFSGMDESLLRSTLPKDADVQNSAVYKQFSGATATVRRERLMPFLWRTFAVNHGFIAGDRRAGSRSRSPIATGSRIRATPRS